MTAQRSMTDEQWRPTIHPKYEVSDQGRVRFIGMGGPRLVKAYPLKKGGHLRVEFRIDGRGKKLLVHRLVAVACSPTCCGCVFVVAPNFLAGAL